MVYTVHMAKRTYIRTVNRNGKVGKELSLPAQWCRDHEVDVNDQLLILDNGDGTLTVSPVRDSILEKEV